MTQTMNDLDATLAAMSAAEPADFEPFAPGDLLSDEAAPTLNMWKIVCDGC